MMLSVKGESAALAQAGTHRHARHALDAAGDHHIHLSQMLTMAAAK